MDYNGADGNDLESARNTASEIIQRGLNAMSPAQLKEYAEGLERGVTNRSCAVCDKGFGYTDVCAKSIRKYYGVKQMGTILESARNKASEIIQQELNAMDGTQLNKYAQRLEHKLKPLWQEANLGQM